MKSAITTLKKWLSYLTKKPIRYQVGVSFDNVVSFKKPPTKRQKEKAFRSTKAVYLVRDQEEIGGFEMDGISIRNGVKTMKLRHTLSGEVFTFPIVLFNILFESQNRK